MWKFVQKPMFYLQVIPTSVLRLDQVFDEFLILLEYFVNLGLNTVSGSS